jgi:hypothetical protein
MSEIYERSVDGQWGIRRKFLEQPLAKPNGTIDAPLDVYPADTVAALKRRAPSDLFSWSNYNLWVKEISVLMPPEFREWDPIVHGWKTDWQLSTRSTHSWNPYMMGLLWGAAACKLHNVLGCTWWWKHPLRLPAWVGVWTAIAFGTTFLQRKTEYDFRKARLHANNYYSRVRQVLTERNLNKYGQDHVFQNRPLAMSGQDQRGNIIKP